MNEEISECDVPPSKRMKMDSESIDDKDTVGEDTGKKEEDLTNDPKYNNFVTPEELEKLKEFKVLDEVKSNDEDSNDESESSDGKSEVPEEEIEKMLEEDLPEGFKGVPQPKEKPYVMIQKVVLEEKGVNHWEVLPLDWMVMRHHSGMPVYMHRTTRVCTLSKPYFLGQGNIRHHDIPISAIPCLAYRRALEEERKQQEIDRKIAEEIKNGTWDNVLITQTNQKSTEKVERSNNDTIRINKNRKKSEIHENNNKEASNTDGKGDNIINKDLNKDVTFNDKVDESNRTESTTEKGVSSKNDVKDISNECETNNSIISVKIGNTDNNDEKERKTLSRCPFMNTNKHKKVEYKSVKECPVTGKSGNFKEINKDAQTESEECNAERAEECPINEVNKDDTVSDMPINDGSEKSAVNEINTESNAEGVQECPNNKVNKDDTLNDKASNNVTQKSADVSDIEILPIKDTQDNTEGSNAEGASTNEVNKSDPVSDKPSNDVEIPKYRRPVILSGGVVMPAPKVETINSSWKTQHLSHEQVNEYCRKLFKFKTVNIMHFNRWADRRKYNKARKTLQYPTLPDGTKLITIPALPNGEDNGDKPAKRDWVMNMDGRSYLSVFHEYARRALQKQPVYEFVQLENAATPYQATVYIGGMQYGVGHGSSKRQAKSAAARASIHILIPEMKDELDAPNNSEPDFSFFDYVGIEDTRISEFCAATCEPSPHAILRTCLLRNFGARDRYIHIETKKLEFQKVELTMKVGKHTATVICKNKKTAKQRASQAILQALHPRVRSWGSLLRLYGSRSVKSFKEKKLEEQQITLLQDRARHNQPNRAVLDKLRRDMARLRERDAACVPIGTLLLEDDLPTHSGSNLNNVDL